MNFLPEKISTRLTIGALTLVILLAIAIVSVMVFLGQPRVLAAGHEKMEQHGLAITKELSLKLASIEGLTASMSRLAEVLTHEEALWRGSFANVIDNNGDKAIAGGGVWPEPNGFYIGVDRRSFFWGRDDNGKLDYSDGYNDPAGPGYHNDAWYTSARNAPIDRCVWSEAYTDPVSNMPMVTCTVPYRKGGQLGGVSTIDLRLDDLSAFLQEQGTETGGYAIALDQAGNILYFPDADQITPKSKDEMLNFTTVVEQHGWLQPLLRASETLAQGELETQTIELDHDQRLGEASQATLFKMPQTGWIVGLVVPKAKISELADVLTRDLLVLLLPITALAMFFIWIAGRRILASIEETSAQIEALSSDNSGQTRHLAIARNDEIGILRGAVNHYADHLQDMLSSIVEESRTLSSEANSLGELSATLLHRIEQQREQNTALTEAVDSLAASATDVTSNTQACVELAQESVSVVHDGQRRVSASQQGVATLSEEIIAATRVIEALEKGSQDASRVLEVIKAISEQTNLLALNAAIEAARAGEQGRGFAVVADEVRTLAAQTQTSANEIGEMINGLQKSAQQAVEAMQTGTEQAKNTVSQTEEAANVLVQTVESFDNISARTHEIAASAQKQSEITLQIHDLAEQVQNIAEENTHDAENLAQASASMQQLAERLEQLSGK